MRSDIMRPESKGRKTVNRKPLAIASAMIIPIGLIILAYRVPHPRPVEGMSDTQRSVSDAMIRSESGAPLKMCDFSSRLGKIIQSHFPEMYAGRDSAAVFESVLDSAALALSTRLFGTTDARRIAGELTDFIFNGLGIVFDDGRNDVHTLFPRQVVAHRRGSCVGMSLLYLLMAEKLDLPMHAVLAPGHMFVRYDDGTQRLNIETLRKGEHMSDEWYRKRYTISDTSLYPLENLTMDELAAVVHYNIGTIHLHDRQYERAKRALLESVEGMPDFPEAQGNLAIAYDALGESGRALALLTSLKEKYPALGNIDRNLASLQLKCGKYREACATYSSLSVRWLDDPETHYGHAVALHLLERDGEAAAALLKALELRPGYREARALLEKLGAHGE